MTMSSMQSIKVNRRRTDRQKAIAKAHLVNKVEPKTIKNHKAREIVLQQIFFLDERNFLFQFYWGARYKVCIYCGDHTRLVCLHTTVVELSDLTLSSIHPIQG